MLCTDVRCYVKHTRLCRQRSLLKVVISGAGLKARTNLNGNVNFLFPLQALNYMQSGDYRHSVKINNRWLKMTDDLHFVGLHNKNQRNNDFCIFYFRNRHETLGLTKRKSI